MNNINSKGFTLIEVIVALALVSLIASFACSAIVSAQKSSVKTAEISKGMDTALAGSESYLASDGQSGTTGTAGEYMLKRDTSSKGMAGFPDIELEINDSLDSAGGVSGTDVRYVAFKKANAKDAESSGGSVSDSGGGATSSEDKHDNPDNESSDSDSKSVEGETSAPEATTQATTNAPVVEPETQPTTKSQPVTEAPTQTTTEAAKDVSKGIVTFDSNMKNKCDVWNWGFPVYHWNSGMMDFGTGSLYVNNFQVKDINENGLLLTPNPGILSLSAPSGCSYDVIIHAKSVDSHEPAQYTVNYNNRDVFVTGDTTIQLDGNCSFTIRTSKPVYITSIELIPRK